MVAKALLDSCQGVLGCCYGVNEVLCVGAKRSFFLVNVCSGVLGLWSIIECRVLYCC